MRGTFLTRNDACQAYRGQLWRCFLNVDKKAQAGVYDRLVSKALGKRFKGKVKTYPLASQTLCRPPFGSSQSYDVIQAHGSLVSALLCWHI